MTAFSLDRLFGRGQQRFRDGEAERLGGLEVDRLLVLARRLHRYFGRGQLVADGRQRIIVSAVSLADHPQRPK